MKSLVLLAVKRPVAITVAAMMIIILGIISWRNLSVDLFPDLQSPTILISLSSGDRPALEMERIYGERMEQLLFTVRGQNGVEQVARTGHLITRITFNWGTDTDLALVEVNKAVAALESDPNVDEVQVRRFDPRQLPIVRMGLTSENPQTDLAELRKMVERHVAPALEELQGVAEVRVSGGREKQVQIQVDRSRLEAYGLTLPEVAERVRQSNIDIDAGTLEEDGKVLVVRGISRYHDLKDIQQVVIRYEENANGDVTPIRVANFAKVALVNKDISHTVRVNGVEGVGLAIYKESGSNTVAVSQVVHTAMQAQTVDMPGIDVTWVSDQAELVENAFTNVTSALLLGILLAVAVLIAYLRSLGSVLVVAIAVPVSLLATVFAMQLWGLSLNLITLAGLALGTGMLVDNAIVVIESIFRHRAEGDEPETAAAEGTASVGGAIVASTLTTCVVFLPVLFVQGIAARFVEGISFTVVLSLLSSLLVAIFLIPSLSVWLLPNKSNPGLSLNNERWQHFIHRLLLRPRHCVILCLLLTAGAIYWLAQLGTELLPPSDQRQFSLLLTGQAGEKVESTQVRVEQVESILKLAAEGKIAAMMAEVGRPPDNDRIIRERQTEENTAELTVRLTQDSETANQIVSKARPAVSQLFGTQVSWQLNNSAIAYAMGSSAPPVLIELSGRSLEDLHRSAERLGKNLTRQPALWNVKTSFEGAPQEVHIKLDRHRSDSLGVDMELVGLVLSSVTEGYLTTEMTMGDEEREVIIKMPSRRSDQLLSLPFHTQNGRYLTIGDVAQVQLVEGARKILRRNQHRVAQISALIRPGITVPQAQAQAQQTLAQTQLPQGISASITGLEEERERTVSELYWVGLVAIALVFFVLAGSFESLLHPFTVLAAIPISLIGVAPALGLTGEPISVMAMLGLIVLVGIAVNDAILLVELARHHINQGLDIYSALSKATVLRLRPIIMTTATTVLALLPLTLGVGDATELSAPLAMTVMGGLLASTLGSLLVIPCVYLLLEQSRARWRQALANLFKKKVAVLGRSVTTKSVIE